VNGHKKGSKLMVKGLFFFVFVADIFYI
jgi:hypothetical protein